MTRRNKALVGTVGLAILFFAGIHRFEGDRLAQAGVALWYAIAVFALMRWGSRSSAG